MGSKEEREVQWARRMMLRQLSGNALHALFGPDGKAKFFSSKEKCLRAGVLPTHNVLSGGLLYVPPDANAPSEGGLGGCPWSPLLTRFVSGAGSRNCDSVSTRGPGT